MIAISTNSGEPFELYVIAISTNSLGGSISSTEITLCGSGINKYYG